MAYQPLARKYRPATFEDLVGQSSVAQALTNAIRMGREPHAVIFAGVRGIGKTTTARLYAKALNCESGPTPSPCGRCESCRAIELGNHEDVLEIDGASNTSVDDVRSLRETVGYVPQRSKFKIYIIDEVHMLSQSAFNALLKTLEEPPAHVVFVFATTELQKIPQTIQSRCQTFHLQKFSMEHLIGRIKQILQAESISFDDDALTYVARQGRGSMRDALTLLDQIIAFGDGAVTRASLAGVMTGASASTYVECLKAMLKRDASRMYDLTEELYAQSTSMIDHVEELASYCRHAFVIFDLGIERMDINTLGLERDILQALQQLAESADPLDLNRLFRTLMKCRTELDGSNLDRYVFENYAFEWCQDPGLPKLDELKAYFENAKSNPMAAPQLQAPRTEKRAPSLRKGLMEEIQARGIEAEKSEVVNALVTETKPKPAEAAKVFPATWRELVDTWKRSKPLQARILEEAYLVEYGPNEIVVAVNENSFAAAKLLQPQIQAKVKDAFRELFAFNGGFKVTQRSGATAQPAQQPTETPAPVAQNPAPVSAQPQPADENLLDVRAREKSEERQRLLTEVTESPITKVVLDTFNAKIEKVTLDQK